MLNAGCILAAAFWICVFLRSAKDANPRRQTAQGTPEGWWRAVRSVLREFIESRQQPAPPLHARPHVWLATIAISLAAFQSTLWNPFQFDAFTHLFEVRDAALPTILARFSRGTGETLFFRPVGWLAYWIDAHGSGTDLLRWHLVNILLHAGNGLLVYLLLLRLDLQRFPSAFGALAFLTSGITAEPVAWIDAPFDLLATLFLLLAILELLHWTQSGRWIHLTVGCALVAVACCTKESAFCAPLLIGAIALSKSGPERKRAWTAAGSVAACCFVVFAYRWWALGGIGGYRFTASDLVHVPQLLLFRLWGVLLFPVNWSADVPAIVLFVYTAALMFAAVRSRARRTTLICGIAWLAAAVLPALPIALIPFDLSGSRVYYLASVGFAIVFASTIEGLQPGRTQAGVAVVVVVFDLVLLEHNLVPWSNVSRQAANACRALGVELNKSAGNVEVLDLPSKRDGVYFLSNGFPQCVSFYSGVSPERMVASAPNQWRWIDKASRFERLP
jgi:hypothetical protein